MALQFMAGLKSIGISYEQSFVLAPGRKDEWREEWLAGLRMKATGVVIFDTELYYQKLRDPKKSALKFEGEQIIAKLRDDPEFIFVVASEPNNAIMQVQYILNDKLKSRQYNYASWLQQFTKAVEAAKAAKASGYVAPPPVVAVPAAALAAPVKEAPAVEAPASVNTLAQLAELVGESVFFLMDLSADDLDELMRERKIDVISRKKIRNDKAKLAEEKEKAEKAAFRENLEEQKAHALTCSETGNEEQLSELLAAASRTGCVAEVLDARTEKSIDAGRYRIAEKATPLMLAVGFGHQACVQVILASARDAGCANAVLIAKSDGGATPLHYAADRGFEACVQVILASARDAKLTQAVLVAKEDDGWTALHCAASSGFEGCVQVILDSAQDAQLTQALLIAKNDFGSTPLHYAASNGFEGVARQLLEAARDANCAEAVVNVQYANGDTPLIMAAYHGFEASVRLLVEAGADKSLKTNWGHTARYWAERNGHRAVVALLR